MKHARVVIPHLLGSVLIAAVPPERIPTPVARVFERACRDCHSARTEWPWYARIPPLSFGIEADVRRGRAAWNLSEWNAYSKGRKLGFLAAITVDVARQDMPPRMYRWMHPGSALSDADRALLIGWATAEGKRLRNGPAHLPMRAAHSK